MDDKIRSHPPSPEYRSGWDQIWGKRKRAEKRAQDRDLARFCWECGVRHFLEDDCES